MTKTRKEPRPRQPVRGPGELPSPEQGGGREESGVRIVGLGGSAGGLEAFGQFFSHLPSDTGLAFVLVAHLDPTHKGMMPELLGRHTPLKVVEAEDGMQVEPDHVYVIPPNADLAVLHGRLQVLEPTAPRGLRMPIDFFFRQLAADQKERAIVIIFSGMGTDGTIGLKAIKENSGMAMVQDPASARYDGMPRSAVNTGLVDYVAAAEELPAKLTQYVIHAPHLPKELDPVEGEATAALQKVFVLLRTRTGNDFSCYKNSTISRRIERRMSVHQFDNLSRYVRFLQENPQEVELLYKELLIGVTNFFRDPSLFDYLRDQAIPRLLRERPHGGVLRVWNPGCSTGEETYSLAITLRECLEGPGLAESPSVQIFATDIDHDAIAKARQGLFSVSIAADVSPERLERFFVREDGGYRARKEIRNLVVFAPQNILVDSPFTKLDILSCRNLLIYVNAEAQKKLLPLMHYALGPGGILILGTSEGIGGFDRLFTPLDQKWKVFRRNEGRERGFPEMPASPVRREPAPMPGKETSREPVVDVAYSAQRILLDEYGPPSVVITKEGDIVYFNGRTGRYLEPSSGKVNINIFAMAREGLREELALAVLQASERKSPVVCNAVKIRSDGAWATTNLTVRPLHEPAELRGMFLVVFDETREGPADPAAEMHPELPGPVAKQSEMEAELRRTRERLQATIAGMQAAQEQLRSVNEELQSNNEEVQSTNEELTSSKEELQSLNEEMQTVNAELQSKLDELSQSNSDMKNLLNGTEIATVFLDGDLCLKRYTDPASRIVNLTAGDIGRPIRHFTTNLDYDRLAKDAQEVLDTLAPKELHVRSADHRWYNMRILPYRTARDMIDGVVVTFADITALKQTEARLQEARAFAESIIATIREPLVVLDGELRIISASRSFYSMFQANPAETEGRRLSDIGQRQWENPALRQLLDELLVKRTPFEDFRVEYESAATGPKVLVLNARRLVREAGQPDLILLAMEDAVPPSTPGGSPRELP